VGVVRDKKDQYMSKRKLATAMLSLSLVLLGCYPQGPVYVEDVDLVATNHDPSFDYQKMKTYALPDEVVKITGKVILGGNPEFVNDAYSQNILAVIRQNMSDMGWTEVAELAQPDVIILPSTIQTTTEVWYYDPWYWGWYYPYYYGGYYYSYPYYGGSYTTGSLFIQMTWPGGITATDNLPVVWNAVLNGLLEGSTSSVNARVTDGINQAFAQSPYLQQ
jgi:hypothetical protein